MNDNLSKPQAWHIIAARSAVYIIYHIENKLKYSNKTKPFPIAHAEFISVKL